jgi:hypothetical protein
MVFITKSQAKSSLKAILTDILEDDINDGTPGPIALSLKECGCRGILDVNSLSASTLEALSYKDADSKVIPLGKGDIGLIKTFHAYIYYKDAIGETIDNLDKWTALTLDDFQQFLVSKEWFSISENPGKAMPSSTSGNHTSRDAVSNFKRGIKRDISLFPTLKQDKQ